MSAENGFPHRVRRRPHPTQWPTVLALTIDRLLFRSFCVSALDIDSVCANIGTSLMSEAAMETMRVKLKVGEHEFEAEGPIEAVQSQLATWKELIAETT